MSLPRPLILSLISRFRSPFILCPPFPNPPPPPSPLLLFPDLSPALTQTDSCFHTRSSTTLTPRLPQRAETIRKATPAERISMLESARGELVAKKLGLERKMEELQRRKGGMSREEAGAGRERR